MNWLDLLIIYVACGMPFAVYRFALSEGGARETAVRSVRAGLFWPFDGAKATFKRLRAASRTLATPRVEIIRAQMQEALASDIQNFPTFEFREVFDRYTGLMQALNFPIASTLRALLEIEGRQPTPMANACLRRSAHMKIGRHSDSARHEFMEFLTASRSSRAFELAAVLASELSDSSLIVELSRHFTGTRQFSPALPRLSGSTS